ncbi:hypothetical protein EBU99_03450 [bacterium]|nr:hypothetical protein [bacterium]
MAIDNEILVRARAAAWQRDADDVSLPKEFHSLVQVGRDVSTTLENWLLIFSLLCVSAGALFPFFSTPLTRSQVALRASSLENSEALGFVTFLGEIEDLSGSKSKDMFGWGALDLVSRASQALAPYLQTCRAQVQGDPKGLSFRFDVKIDVKKPGFTVNGLLDGQDKEPAVATCLRDKINGLVISDFANLRAAPPKSYRMRLSVDMAHGSDGGVP